MKTKRIWANLATTNLEWTIKFYTALGFKQNGQYSQESELVSFSFGQDDFVINFFVKDILQKNTHTPLSDLKSGNEVIFSMSVASREELEEWVNAVKNAGGKITAEPYKIGEGYTFVFADPDGHRFNILFWPGM